VNIVIKKRPFVVAALKIGPFVVEAEFFFRRGRSLVQRRIPLKPPKNLNSTISRLKLLCIIQGVS
jgi:hypothetical protein